MRSTRRRDPESHIRLSVNSVLFDIREFVLASCNEALRDVTPRSLLSSSTTDVSDKSDGSIFKLE